MSVDAQPGAGAEASAQPSHVLVVDDDLAMLSVLTGFLGSSKYKVTIAADGNSALEIVDNAELALVISDVRMNPMNGIELLRRIKQRRPGLPVIILTAYASRETRTESMELGAYAYLQKPFLNRELLDTVEQAILQSRMNDAS